MGMKRGYVSNELLGKIFGPERMMYDVRGFYGSEKLGCGLVGGSQCFVGTCCLHLHGTYLQLFRKL
jgi:hypothetical protein